MKMALGKVCRSCSLKLNHDVVNDGNELRPRFVRCNSVLGRKRIEISKEMDQACPFDSPTKAPFLKRHCSERRNNNGNAKSALESLPQDVLIRIICGVEHEDLNQLLTVSKSIRASTIIAKKMHFAYRTPTKSKCFRTSIDLEGTSELHFIDEAPNAPRQSRSHRSINRKRLADISVELFTC